jgi:decaprenylphospho-beta-D-ribofuranose 2-oxidase
MQIYGWGRYPKLDSQVLEPLSASQCASTLKTSSPLIALGLGRSYGDSALAPLVLSTRYINHFQAFDEVTGLLTCAAGVSLDSILRNFVKRGWFLPVTPGTRFVTVGGAIASDVHGKNHHKDGTFCTHVVEIKLLLGNGECVTASPAENADLFHATCGGMGLTGIILSASVQLRRISASDIVETTIKAPSLDAVLEAFEVHAASTYSVAWIDCLARGAKLGRSLLMLGDHVNDGALAMKTHSPKRVPFYLPAVWLNQTTVQVFNTFYFHRVRHRQSQRRVAFEPFFFPLDALAHWNRVYGKPGFVQYQFVLPKAAGVAGLREVLECIAQSGLGSFLAVLKVFGAANDNLLSFPVGGYTLALDFKVEPTVFKLLNTLDAIVLHYGGRLYLTKDARMSEATFKAGYPRWQEFEATRERWHAHGNFASSQSRRLGLL